MEHFPFLRSINEQSVLKLPAINLPQLIPSRLIVVIQASACVYSALRSCVRAQADALQNTAGTLMLAFKT